MSSLTVQERIDLSHHEQAIEHGRHATLKMAQALLDIRNRRLYRENHETFDRYCEDRWHFSRQHGYYLCNFATTVAELQSVSTTVYIPENERQNRPLQGLESAEQKCNAMEAAATITRGERPNSGHIRRAAAAAKSQSPTPAIGQAVTVLDEESEHYGKQATIVSTASNGLIVSCQVEGTAQPQPFLINEVGSSQPAAQSKPSPAQPKPPSPIEALQTALDIEQARVAILEGVLSRLIVAIRSGGNLEHLTHEAEQLLA